MTKSITKQMTHNNLVIAAVGDSSIHKFWVEASKFKNFDLCLIYYGNVRDKYYSECDIYIEKKGYKYPLIYDSLLNVETLNCYDYYWLPDDDIKASTADINLMFEMMKKNNFYIAQPSLKSGCSHTWPHTTTQPNNVARETKFVEIMCPLFSYQSLHSFVDYFNHTKTGWGLDYLWSKKTLEMGKKLGIYDIVSVEHIRAMGRGDLYTNLKKDNINYKQELADFMKKYNLTRIQQKDKKVNY